mmetsp:Transcript_20959/g.54736  ORF Transcript_20959/g.54736 Transcript_20959/m.54736 type:complete len:419 (+) Transcript_20959:93-1349(+)
MIERARAEEVARVGVHWRKLSAARARSEPGVTLLLVTVMTMLAVTPSAATSRAEVRRDTAGGRRLLYGDYGSFRSGGYYDYDYEDQVTAAARTQEPSTTLEAVKTRGYVMLGNRGATPGFGVEENGQWEGFDVDFGRVLAAAIFGDATKLEVVKTTAVDRFPALSAGLFDVLVSTTTWTSARDRELGLEFCGVNFYTGQEFLVNTKIVHAADSTLKFSDLEGQRIGVTIGTTTEQQLNAYMARHRFSYEQYAVSDKLSLAEALRTNMVAAVTADALDLISLKAECSDWKQLTHGITQEPLGPVVLEGDPQWADIVRWTLMATINAEWLVISSQNVDEILQGCLAEGCDPAVSFLLGATPGVGEGFGLDDKWVYNIVKQVGNYGEIFDRNLAAMGFERGMNALSDKGGLMYSLPLKPLY